MGLRMKCGALVVFTLLIPLSKARADVECRVTAPSGDRAKNGWYQKWNSGKCTRHYSNFVGNQALDIPVDCKSMMEHLLAEKDDVIYVDANCSGRRLIDTK